MSESRSHSTPRWPLAAILLLALVARLLAGVYVARQVSAENRKTGEASPFRFPDSHGMMTTAKHLATGQGHVDGQGRYAWRTPLYQGFLALLIRLGLGAAGAIRAVQAGVGVANCLLLYWIARRLGGTRAGLYAAGIGAIYPMLVYFSALVLTETLSVTLVLLVVLTQFRLVESGRPGEAAWAGVALGLAGLLKASLGLLVVPLLLWHVLVVWPRRPPVLLLAVMLLGWAVPVGSWAARNAHVLGTPIFFSTMGGFTLFESTGPQADGGPNHGKVALPPAIEGLPEVERDAAFKRAVWKWVRAHPAAALALSWQKFRRTWSPLPNWSGAQAWHYRLALCGSYVPVMVLAFTCLWRRRRHWRLLGFLCIPVVYVALVHTVFMGSIRYRVSVLGCLILLAALGLHHHLDRLAPHSDSPGGAQMH